MIEIIPAILTKDSSEFADMVKEIIKENKTSWWFKYR